MTHDAITYAGADAAAQMTDEQKKQVEKLRQVIAKLSRQRRARLAEILKP